MITAEHEQAEQDRPAVAEQAVEMREHPVDGRADLLEDRRRSASGRDRQKRTRRRRCAADSRAACESTSHADPAGSASVVVRRSRRCRLPATSGGVDVRPAMIGPSTGLVDGREVLGLRQRGQRRDRLRGGRSTSAASARVEQPDVGRREARRRRGPRVRCLMPRPVMSADADDAARRAAASQRACEHLDVEPLFADAHVVVEEGHADVGDRPDEDRGDRARQLVVDEACCSGSSADPGSSKMAATHRRDDPRDQAEQQDAARRSARTAR